MSRFPHTLLIILFFIALAGLAAYLLPAGEYERTTDPVSGREVVVPGSYHRVQTTPPSPFAMLVDIPRGIAAGVEVIVSIFIAGACFYVVEKTGALRQGILLITTRLGKREELTLVLTGLFFLIGGTLEGMEEELIPLMPVLLMLTRRLGYDAFVAVAVGYGSAEIGASFSPFNPFGAVLAQKIAQVPLLTGATFMIIALFAVFAAWMILVIRYGRAHRVTREDDNVERAAVSPRHGIILLAVVVAFAVLIYGMTFWNWGFNELSAEFFLLAAVAGLAGGLGFNGISAAFVEGLREMTFAALIVGFAHAIPLVLQDGKVLDTIVYGLFVPMENLTPNLTAVGMMVSQSVLHVLIPSYTGQAALTIPILVPLSDLIGMSRQVCVMAFQYGAILMNMVSPTNGALMAILALSGIRYDRWFAFALKRYAVLAAIGALSLILANLSG